MERSQSSLGNLFLQPPPPASSKQVIAAARICLHLVSLNHSGQLELSMHFMSCFPKLLQVDLCFFSSLLSATSLLITTTYHHAFRSYIFIVSLQKLNMIIINMDTLQNQNLTMRNMSDKPKLRDILYKKS